jgi:hypothetical protein
MGGGQETTLLAKKVNTAFGKRQTEVDQKSNGTHSLARCTLSRPAILVRILGYLGQNPALKGRLFSLQLCSPITTLIWNLVLMSRLLVHTLCSALSPWLNHISAALWSGVARGAIGGGPSVSDVLHSTILNVMTPKN